MGHDEEHVSTIISSQRSEAILGEPERIRRRLKRIAPAEHDRSSPNENVNRHPHGRADERNREREERVPDAPRVRLEALAEARELRR